MQFFTSESGSQEHQEPLITPSEPVLCKKRKGVCCGRLRRLFMKIVVLLPVLLAATAYVSYEKAKSYSRSVSDVCYGRYEKCMEMSWGGNVDHQPTEGDAYFFPYVSGGFMSPSDAVMDLWNKDCAAFMAAVPNFKLQHGAPWHCQCTQEIFVRCNSPDLPYFESSDPETAHWMKFPGLLGSEYRKEAISSSIKAFTVYSYTSFAATAMALIAFVAISMKCLKRMGRTSN